MKYRLSFIVLLFVLEGATISYAQRDCDRILLMAIELIDKGEYFEASDMLDAVLICDHESSEKVRRLRHEIIRRISVGKMHAEIKAITLQQEMESSKSKEKLFWGVSLNCYAEFMNSGDSLFKEQYFLDAINQYEAAKRCDDFSDKERGATGNKTAQERVNDCLKAIEQQRIDAARAFAKADSALQKAQKLIDAFYFYADRFALAFKDDNFYFIDKNGDEVTKLGTWEKAEQFEWTDFANVKSEENGKLVNYLLDTIGNTYLVAYDVKDLTENVTALDLSDKKLSTIPGTVFHNAQLKILLLHSNQLDSLPEQIRELKNLTSLNLSYNKLNNLPEQIGELKNLTELNLSGNPLNSLPEQTTELKNLTSLSLHDSQLNSLPEQIRELKNLTNLYVGFNQLGSLPEQIGELKNLATLYLSNNKLNSLPEQIGELKNLTSLDLSGNRLDSLPEQIGELKKLTSLELSYNQLSSLPKRIGELKNLTELNLSNNQLNSLPEQIGELKNLTTLDLGGDFRSERRNQIKELPIEIRHLKNLTELDLSGNQLRSLPDEIGQLKNLQSFGLPQNKLATLPAEIGQLKKLKQLDLFGNDSLDISSLCPVLQEFPKTIYISTGEYASNTYQEILLIIIKKQNTLIGRIEHWENQQPFNLTSHQRLLFSQSDPFSKLYIGQLRADMPGCSIYWEPLK